jgi:hypothetical protein
LRIRETMWRVANWISFLQIQFYNFNLYKFSLSDLFKVYRISFRFQYEITFKHFQYELSQFQCEYFFANARLITYFGNFFLVFFVTLVA